MSINNKGLASLWGYPLIDKKARNAISDTRSSLENSFQKKTDDTLGTTDKTVPGAINEVKNSIDTIGDNFSNEQTDTKYDMKYKGKSIGSIDMELTDNQIVGGDGSFNIDLTPYQTKNDDNLTTTNKTISGAINEINTQCKDIAKNKQILLVTQKQYEDLVSGKEVTIDDVKYTYNENTIYGITDNIDSNTILTSPNGTEYTLKVDDNGNLSTELRPIICTDVSLNESNLTFNSKSAQTLTATFTPVNTSEAKVWSSNNESVAKVENGIVTPVSNGQCTIKITCGTKSATCSVVVNIPVEVKDFTNYAYNTDTFTNPTSTSLQNNKTYYILYNLNKTVSDGVMTLTKKDNLTSTDSAYLLIKFAIADNNTYYCRAKIKTNGSQITAGNNQKQDKDSVPNDGEWHLVSYICKDSNINTNSFVIECTTLNVGESVQIKELMKINLTEIYGSNNEPTKEVCDTIFTNYKTGLVG